MIGDPQSSAPELPAPTAAAIPTVATPPRRRGRAIWIIAGLAFALGIVAMYYALPLIERWRNPTQTTTTITTPTAQPVATTAPAQPTITAASPVTLDGLAAREAALDAQLREIEGRITLVDTASRTAAGYARRAEGLMIAFAARRALDRGLQLGYVEGQLRDRFSADQPQALATVVAAAKNPVTLGDLREGLSRIAPTLTRSAWREGYAASVWQELSNLVVLRRDTTPSPRPDDRLARARIVLDGGNVEAALAEVARMPGASDPAGAGWIDAAKRYIDARVALGTLELAAINGRADPATSPPASAPATTAPNPAGQLPGA